MQDFIADIFVRFSSRKFLLAVLGIAVAFGANVSDGQLTAITALIVAFTAAEGAADYAARKDIL
jgi:hypothetical protein